MAERLSARVFGMVQGVGYRYFVISQARRLGLTGFVRNLSDGSVEVEAEGEAGRLRQLLSLLGSGPAGATVERVEAGWGRPGGRYQSFDINH